MKGIILAGGTATRLYPITLAISKQLLPVYDKPMIYYPLSTLMLADIKDVLIISTEKHIGMFKNLLGDGGNLGMKIEYAIQERPKGIAEALIIAEKFIGDDTIALILGDNIIYGSDIEELLVKYSKLENGATIFGYRMKDASSYGVVEIDENGKAISIEEKPKNPKSDLAVIGLYFFDNKAIEFAKKITPSDRGELEITDINNEYLKNKELSVVSLKSGYAWFDMGMPERLSNASEYVRAIELRQGNQIACIEEIAYKKGWIDKKKLENIVKIYKETDYGKYLKMYIN